MKAAYIEQQGGPEVFKFGELPDPKAGAGEIVVDIVAASVNGADYKVRNGGYGTTLKFPYVLGRFDFSGTVSAVGEGVNDFKIGDEVFAVLPGGLRALMRRRSRSRLTSWRRSLRASRM